MAIFKKLLVGDTVATSGTRVFKKLITEEPGLPIWNGTDLKGTSWTIPAGWTAEAGYGVFDVSIMSRIEGDWEVSYTGLYIGYATENPLGETPFATANNILMVTLGYRSVDPSKGLNFRFLNGTDTTNPRLISWLLENGRLTSHRLQAGLYDADNKLVASWDTLVNTYGMDESWDDWGYHGTEVSGSPTRVLNDNSDLANGTKFVIDSSIQYIGMSAFHSCARLTHIHIPEGVKEIWNSGFNNCTSLESVILPDSTEFLGLTVFRDCTNLKSITIGKGMKEIRALAFYNCTSLTDVYYRGTEEQWSAIYGIEELENATIHYNSL